VFGAKDLAKDLAKGLDATGGHPARRLLMQPDGVPEMDTREWPDLKTWAP
jgi:hypothetical protein